MLLAPLLALLAEPQGKPSFRELDYRGAVSAAQTEQKLLLLDFLRPKSVECERMATSTWPSPVTQVWLQSNFVAVHVDVEADPATAERYHVTQVPLVVIAAANGVEVDRIEGFIAPMDMLERAKPMIRWAKRISTARETLDIDPGNPWLHWDLGRAFRKSHMEQRALDEMLVAWDLGASVPTFVRDRETLLAYELGILAKTFKPAHRQLAKRCEEASAQVTAAAEGVDVTRAARDLALIRDQLGLSQETLTLRDELAKRTPPPTALLTALFTDGMATLLYRERRYEEMLAGRGDALLYVDGMLAQISAALREIEAQKNTAADDLDEPEIETFDPVAGNIELGIATCVMYYEALVGTGREKDARDVMKTLLTVSHTSRTFARLVTASGRAGDEELAREIGERGMSELPDKNDRTLIRQALNNLGEKRKRF